MGDRLSPPRSLLLAAALVLLSAVPAAAEHPNHARGFNARNAFTVGNLESVNLFNGNLTLTIPIGPSYPLGPEFSYGLSLTYTGNVWEWQDQVDEPTTTSYLQAEPRQGTNAGLGWRLGLGRLVSTAEPSNPSPNPAYESPDQAVHELHQSRLHPTGQTFSTDTLFTQDSTYLRFTASTNRLELPDGTVETFGPDGLETIEDAFGNALTIAYSNFDAAGDPLLWTLTDTHGRTHTVHLVKLLGKLVVSQVQLDKFGSGSASYDFSYATNVAIPRACNDPVVCDGLTGRKCGNTSNVTVPLLTRVTLPDGSSYSMMTASAPAYHVDSAPTCPAGTGERMINGHLERMELPTGGAFEWTWQSWTFPVESASPGPLQGGVNSPFRRAVGLAQRRWIRRSGSELGHWTYTPSLAQDASTLRLVEEKTKVVDPLGHRSDHYFSVYKDDHNAATPEPTGWDENEYGLPFTRFTSDNTTPGRFLSEQVLGSAGGLLRSVYVRYETSGPTPANPRLASERTVYHDDAGRVADLDLSDFDGLGHYRHEETGGDFPGGNARTTVTDWNPGSSLSNVPTPGQPWILDTYDQRSVTEGSQTVVQQFDFNAHGFLHRVRTLQGATCGPSDVLVERTPFPLSDPDHPGFLAREDFYGGDGAGLTCGALGSLTLPALPTYRRKHTYTCGSLATTRWFVPGGSALSFFSADRTIDCSTGLPSASRDTAGLQTSYSYDGLGRLTKETPGAGEAQTVYVYAAETATSPAKVAIQRKSGNQVLAGQQLLFDGFGRVSEEQRDLPGGSQAVRSTSWDALGQVVSRSEWHLSTTGAGSTVYGGYDSFGRPGSITLPDGLQVTLGYTGVRARTITVPVATSLDGTGQPVLADVSTTEVYDRFGRLFHLTEPNGTRTSYAYDPQGNLIRVDMNDLGSPVQTRTFSYDGRGFLTSETHPELGTAVLYSEYDPLGSPGRIQRGGWDLAYTYDAAGRLTEIRQRGTSTVWKSWTYATANNQAGAWSNGKLAATTRHNHVTVPGSATPFDAAVTESYQYSGVGGRISQVTTDVTTGSPADNTRPTFDYQIGYDPLGNVSSRTYPHCTHNYCLGSAADVVRIFAQSFTEGLLTAIPGYASAITYHGNGLYDQVVHANGVTDHQDRDPSAMARPGRLFTTGASDDLDTGLYAYDGAGNVTKMGSFRYVYDQLSRITEARVEIPPSSAGCGQILVVQGTTDTGTLTHESCGTVQAGPSYTVASTGDVTLRAGHLVVFADGFSVAAGGRLTAAVDPALDPPGAAVGATQSYGYDRYGNLLSVTTQLEGQSAQTRTFGTSASTNRLTVATYDLSGNVTSRVGRNYHYDPFNMLWQTEPNGGNGVTFVYGPGDERIWTVDWTAGADPSNWLETWTLRDLDGAPLRQLQIQGGNTGTIHWSFHRDHVFRGGALLAAETPEGTRHFHLDHLSSPRLVTDAAGTTVARHLYYPFGEEATDPTQDALELKFTGHERDDLDPTGSISDLDYMHARYHSPYLGRFISVDPVLASAEPSRPETWNRYSYVYGNPIKYLDPDGETVESALQLITANAQTILSASALSSGQVTPVEIARVLFQENMNDHNLIRGSDASAFVVGGPEVKNMGAIARFSVFGVHGSFGIAEMRTDTAARLLGWDPDNLTAEQTQKITKILSGPKGAIILIAAYLAQLKKARPNAPTDIILSDYNRGLSSSDQVNSVGGRSGAYINEIVEALGRGLNAGGEIEVVRCGNEYKFSNQCGAGSE